MGEKTTSATTSTVLANIFNVVLLYCELQYYWYTVMHKKKRLVWDRDANYPLYKSVCWFKIYKNKLI
jgi:hypothetical protein